jgi:restriction system protein
LPRGEQRLRRQRALRDLATLTWQQFEEVIADAFRRHGYRVREVGGRGTADGGVDVVLVRDGETTVVQAKHWRRDRVGVQLVRELYGVQLAMRAEHAMFVVMGGYTADARQFGGQVGLTLVDGEELLRIIGTGLRGEALELPQPAAISAPPCPACGGVMVRRTARQGPYAGHDFWGCSAFPECRGTVAIPDEVPVAL